MKKEIWVNVFEYENGDVYVEYHYSKESADANKIGQLVGSRERVKCKKIKW